MKKPKATTLTPSASEASRHRAREVQLLTGDQLDALARRLRVFSYKPKPPLTYGRRGWTALDNRGRHQWDPRDRRDYTQGR